MLFSQFVQIPADVDAKIFPEAQESGARLRRDRGQSLSDEGNFRFAHACDHRRHVVGWRSALESRWNGRHSFFHNRGNAALRWMDRKWRNAKASPKCLRSYTKNGRGWA